jgi:hypothetical protein
LNDFVQNSFNKSAVFHAGSGNMPPASELLGDIQVDGDSAVAPLRAANKRFPIQLVFSREKGQWKIDPFPILANLQLILSFDQMKNNRTADQESDIYLRQIPDFDSMGKPAKQTGVDDSGLEKAAPPVPTVSASPPSPVISATPAASPTP